MKGLAFCDDWAKKFAARHIGDLSSSELDEFLQHAAQCSLCAAVYATYNLIEACMQALPQVAPLPSRIPEFQQIRHNNQYLSYQDSAESLQPGALSTVPLPRKGSPAPRTTDVRLLQISVRCANRFMEVTLDELESAELAVEDGVGTVLLDIFETVAIDEVSISFTLDQGVEHQMCTIRIDVWCPFSPVPVHPHELENIEFAVEDRIGCVLAELFGEVIVDEVRIDYLTSVQENDSIP